MLVFSKYISDTGKLPMLYLHSPQLKKMFNLFIKQVMWFYADRLAGRALFLKKNVQSSWEKGKGSE